MHYENFTKISRDDTFKKWFYQDYIENKECPFCGLLEFVDDDIGYNDDTAYIVICKKCGYKMIFSMGWLVEFFKTDANGNKKIVKKIEKDIEEEEDYQAHMRQRDKEGYEKHLQRMKCIEADKRFFGD